MRSDMIASQWSRAVAPLRGLSSRLSSPAPTRLWVISLASVFVVALLLIGNTHSPFWAYVRKGPPRPPPPPPPPPYGPKPPEVEGGLMIWDPPEMDALVHGVLASDGIKRKPKYPLDPFPLSPMSMPPPPPAAEDGRQNPWLGAVICSAWDIKRRMLIRYTWMKLYKDVPMDQRFVISNPGPQWTAIVQQENRTFGDMIVLDHLQEDDFTANTVKTIEFYRWLVEKSPRKYEFVSKMDTDLFLNARGMWDRKLLPRLRPASPVPAANSTDAAGAAAVPKLAATVNYTIIGQFYYDGYHHTSFPHGAIYTVTWDIVELLPRLQDEFHIIAGEDVTMAWLLMKGRRKVTMAVLTEAEKFEFDRKDMRPGPERSPWARPGTDVTSSWHALSGADALAIHQLKSDDDWLMVAACFDERGIKEMPPYPPPPGSSDPPPPPPPPPDDGDKPGYPRPFYTRIPDSYWEVDHDGTLLCNGVWKLEPGVGRDMKKKEEGGL